MRHFYFRLIIGIVWLIVGGVNALCGSFLMFVLYLAVGTAFLLSAHSIWKKEKEERK